MEKFIPFFIFLGVMFGGGLLFYIFHKKPSTKNYQKSQSTKTSTGNYQDPVKRRDPFVRTPPVLSAEQQEARKRQLNSIIHTMRDENQTKLLSLDDIASYDAHDFLSPSETEYIAKQLPTSLFSTSVWDIHQKIKNQSLTDDEILAILDSGTKNLLTILNNSYSGSNIWTMSSMLLGQLILKHPLALFYFNNYNKDMLMTIINRLSAYELLGYRMKPKTSAEQFSDSFLDLQKSTEDDETFIQYYESADTDMVYFIEQNYPNEIEARAKAFAKILSGSTNIIAMINRVDTLSDKEMKQIIARNYSSEISALFDACAASDVANCFPALYAVKAVLGLIECEYSDEIKDNYSFSAVSLSMYQEIIASLSAKELLGYDSRGPGNYDIIKLFEDHSIDDEAIRELAFDKMRTSTHFADAIARWDTVSEDEIVKIMERDIEEQVTAFFERNNSEEIGNIPEETAIKIVLQIKYPEFMETVRDNYSFINKDAFLNVIKELSPYELLGWRIQANTPEEKAYTMITNLETNEAIPIYNDADDDIITLIENDMADDSMLRDAAFTKICESKNMVDAIARWDTVTDDEIAKIMERGYQDEINELLGRDDSDSIIEGLPEEIAIKVALELIYEDAAQTVRDNYSFTNKDAFLNVIKELSAYELLGWRIQANTHEEKAYTMITNLETNEAIPIYNDADDDIISLIEDDMSDDTMLRDAAFTKICESKNMVDAIARWENVTEEEIAKIMERGYEEEINALLGRDNSESIIEDLPEEVAIKVALELVYEDAAETLRNNYSFSNKDTFLKVINELSPYELLGFRIHGDGSYEGSVTNLENGEEFSIYHDGDYDIISLIENDMSDDSILRTTAFAKICESKNMVDAIGRWETITDDEATKIMERGYQKEIDELFDRSDSDDIISSLPDTLIIKQQLIGDNDALFDEYTTRIDDESFRKQVEKIVKKVSIKNLSTKEKDASADELSDDSLIKARLFLIDFDECSSFDSDDVASEYAERMDTNEVFKKKVEAFIAQI